MPAIATTLYPIPAYVRVEANWGDVGAATGAAVYRVDCLTGERVPLRPYISFTGDFLDLSCGYSIFWDTEPQLDRCVYYCTRAIDAAGNLITQPAQPLLTDTFTRTVANGWGNADTGQPYTVINAPASDYSTNGSFGRILNSGTNRHAIVSSGTWTNVQVEGTVYPTVSAAGGPIDQGFLLRATAAPDTGYEGMVRFNPSGFMDARINSQVAGVATNIAFVTNVGVWPNSAVAVRIKFRAWGNQLQLKVWDLTQPEPDWQVSITDTTILTSGGVGAVIRVQAGNSNTPFTSSWDNIYTTDVAADPQIIEACSDSLTVPSSGNLYLGDPTRPCNDLVLSLLDTADPDCVPTQGIFFGSISEDETFEANSGTLLPTNSSEPIGIYRARRSGSGVLNVVTRTFADRDALRRLNKPGSQLLLRSPAKYGVGDRYMLVGGVTEHRVVSDHKVQPRLVAMPHTIPRRARGASQGVCGTRVDDLCDTYPTWDAIAAAGLTWADLVRGKASPKTPKPVRPERTWNDVNSQYANWNAVQAGNTDWDDLLDGA